MQCSKSTNAPVKGGGHAGVGGQAALHRRLAGGGGGEGQRRAADGGPPRQHGQLLRAVVAELGDAQHGRVALSSAVFGGCVQPRSVQVVLKRGKVGKRGGGIRNVERGSSDARQWKIGNAIVGVSRCEAISETGAADRLPPIQ